ncbi:MAG: site-specific integrase [Chloroflexi bacterium]|nr:site-specific integrase [Chloroflexota bacterium]
MLPEVERFGKWLRRRNPHASTHIHYTSDLELFFTWLDKPLTQVSVTDIDRFIEHSQTQGHANATINRRLAAIRSLYHFLAFELDNAPRNPVVPKRHMIQLGRRLPRDVEDAVVEKLFAVITLPRDRCMFLLMLRCGLRVGEIRNLSLDDVHLETTKGNLPRLRVCGKNSTERIAYLSSQAQTALRTWLAVRPPSKDVALFPNCHVQ